LRKYIYGPGIDQPICMIDVEDSNAVSYYHYDGLGSVVALSDEDGDTIQVYEYDVYGNVAASDPNHTNPFMFTGRRLDTETGLYFYRARYYNPAIGRFLQTDPIGYGDGMNWYAYCHNAAIDGSDPSGLGWVRFERHWGRLTLEWYPFSPGQPRRKRLGSWKSTDDFLTDADNGALDVLRKDYWQYWAEGQAAWYVASNHYGRGHTIYDQEWWFWRLVAIMSFEPAWSQTFRQWHSAGCGPTLRLRRRNWFAENTVDWNPNLGNLDPGIDEEGDLREWHNFHPLVGLAHELHHARQYIVGGPRQAGTVGGEKEAVWFENWMRYAMFKLDPSQGNLYPRPGYDAHHADLGDTAEEAWDKYRRTYSP